MAHQTSPCVAAMLCLGMLACSSPASPEAQQPAIPPASTSPATQATIEVVDLTNAERTRTGLAALARNALLMQAAQIHAEQMAEAGRIDHVLPNARYPRTEDRLAAVSYRWQAFGENVALGQRTPAEVVNGWMQSAGHRANIMNTAFTEMGAGYARDANGRSYWVQVFGKPLS